MKILVGLFICIICIQSYGGQSLIKVVSENRTPDLEEKLLGREKIRHDVFLVENGDIHLFKNHPQVLVIEPNHYLQLLNEPNDLKNSQWNFKSSKGFDINIIPAWKLQTGSKKIVVAVIDSGLDLGHPDLKSNIWVNTREAEGQKGVDDDENGYVDDIHGYDFVFKSGYPKDHRGHGTAVAGIIGAIGNNSQGIVGVNWQVSLMALNMFPKYSEAKMSDAIKAIDYAIENGALVINASWAQTYQSDQESTFILLKEAIARAQDKGVVFVAAAGNSANNNDHQHMIPATMDLDNIIAVGAMTEEGLLHENSNYGGNSVEIMAPGKSVLTLALGNGTTYQTGTSIAAPHVAGVAALLLSVDPNLTPLQVKQLMIQSCTPNHQLKDKTVCHGHLNAAGALENLYRMYNK